MVGCWIAITIAGFAAIGPANNALSQQFSVPGGEAFKTNAQFNAIYGNGGDAAPIVPVVRLPQGKTVDSPGVAHELAGALAKVKRALPRARLASYASTHSRAFVSKDGRTTFALVYIPALGGVNQGQAEARTAQAALAGVTVGGSPIDVTGLDALRSGVGKEKSTGVLVETLAAAIGALIVLAFVFASFMAVVPLLMALVALPVPFLRSMGIAGMLIPLVSVAVALTLLPVVLATIGPRLDRRHTGREDRASRAWSAWARIVLRYRWVAAVASTAVLAALLVAASMIQLGNPRADSLAQSGPAHAGLQQLSRSGIGTGPLSPFDALVRAGDPEAVAHALAGVSGVHDAVAPPQWRRDGTAIVTVIPTQDGNSPAGRATLDRIHSATRALPADVTTGGQAAQSADFLDAVYGNFPLLIALIAGLTFILLARAFRSLILPLKAVVLNLLSVAAAWGLMVIVWQHGFGSSAIWGIEATRSINAEMPIVVFAFLFGVSMDYQVFIISRMREAYDRTRSTEAAVIEGIRRTGRLVTSAALILALAFVAMSASPGTEVKIFATALGGGILLDATLVRAVLAPALVALLGRWNWWLPHTPARILRVKPSPVEPLVALEPGRQPA